MALFHFHITQIKRSAGHSAVACAAYRAGEKLYSEYYGEASDFTRKGGVVCSEIILPPHAPAEYQDRATLWNAVEKAGRGKKAQLAYSFDIALQNELSLDENTALARQFVSEQLVGRGMIADLAIHQPDKEDGGISNPHFHILCPIRPIEPDESWGQKQRRVYRLDEGGNRIRDSNGKPLFDAVSTTDWGDPETLEAWRETWAAIAELREVTAYDELGLDTLGDEKTALFLIMSDTDDTFNFLISLCYTQLFNLLCEKADDVYGGRLPVHVRCLIDEAANIGQIPKLEKLVATIRSREISACLVLQAQSQLKAIYSPRCQRRGQALVQASGRSGA